MDRRALWVFMVGFAAGCGSDGGGGGGGGFDIREDFRGQLYVYAIDDGELAFSREPDSGYIVAVVDRSTSVPISFFGPPTGPRAADVVVHMTDADMDGEFGDVAEDAEGSTAWAGDGDSFDTTYTIDILGLPVDFDFDGPLVRTQPFAPSARMARTMTAARRHAGME